MTKRMWYVEKSESGIISKAVVFNQETLGEFQEDGYSITGEYEIQLLQGDNFLPDSVESED